MLLAALKNKAIDKREDLTPEEETQVILKEIKQTKETLDDVMKIQADGRAKRQAAEVEMAKMENELKTKLLQIRSGN